MLRVDGQVLDVELVVGGIDMGWGYDINYLYEDVHEEMQ